MKINSSQIKYIIFIILIIKHFIERVISTGEKLW